jgi:hypothetical protein
MAMTTFDSCKFALNSETYELPTWDAHRYDAPLSPEAALLEASKNIEYRPQPKDGKRFHSLRSCNRHIHEN